MAEGSANARSDKDYAMLTEVMSQIVDLTIPEEFREGVASQLALNAQIIAPLVEFELPEGTTPAPVFEP